MADFHFTDVKASGFATRELISMRILRKYVLRIELAQDRVQWWA
jgi:hypothetical protein